MTIQLPEKPAAVDAAPVQPPATSPASGADGGSAVGTEAGRKPLWRRPWVVPAWLLAAAFLIGFVPRYLTFDPSRSLVRLSEKFPLHYAFLVGHVIFGSVALITVCLQIWPWLREHHPAVHRWSGRLFVFAGVLPSAACAIVIVPFSFAPPGNAANAILWLVTTIIGYRMIRQGRYAEHRRWMIYSFAVTMQIIWGRALFLTMPLFPADPHTQSLLIETASWIGFVVNLLIAQWWLERTANRPLVIRHA
jgi:uncharacterized membrane protein YozB (DUF420 family)